MAKGQEINMGIEHTKEAFYSNGFNIIFGAELFIDFRQTLPRDDETPNGIIRSFAAKHQPIIMTPQTAKMLFIILKEQIEEVEKKSGTEIILPENWRAKPLDNGDVSSSSTSTSYIR